MRAERMTEVVGYHGEGAVWWPRLGRLRCVDMLAGDVLTLDPVTGEVSRVATGSPVAAVVRPRAGAGAVVAVELGLAVADLDDLSDLRVLDPVLAAHGPGGAGLRFNEGGVDPQGRFWAGTMAYDQTPGAAALLRWADPADAAPEVMADGVTVSNGLDWSPDGFRVYYNDTATGRTAVYTADPATGLDEPRVLTTYTPEQGHPDGLTVDAEGGVWVAFYGGGAVRRLDPDSGQVTAEVAVDARQVTSCAFGGRVLDTLFITTSREGLDPEEDPAAGSIFAVRPGVRGLPVREVGDGQR